MFSTFHQSIKNKQISENIRKISKNNNTYIMKIYNCRKCNKIYYNLHSRCSNIKICNKYLKY